jgi:hypothetical protein
MFAVLNFIFYNIAFKLQKVNYPKLKSCVENSTLTEMRD